MSARHVEFTDAFYKSSQNLYPEDPTMVFKSLTWNMVVSIQIAQIDYACSSELLPCKHWQ